MKEKDLDTQSVSGSTPSGDANKRKRKGAPCRKDERADSNSLYKLGSVSAKDEQDMASSSGSGSRSSQPTPTNVTPHPPFRVIDEDYDEGAMDALVVLSFCGAVGFNDEEPTASTHSKREIHPLSPKVLSYADAPKRLRKLKVKANGTIEQLRLCGKLLTELHRQQYFMIANPLYEPVGRCHLSTTASK